MFRKRDIALSAGIAGLWTVGQRLAHYRLLRNDPIYREQQRMKLPLKGKRKKGNGFSWHTPYHEYASKRPQPGGSTRSNAAGIVTDNPMGAVTKGRAKRFNRRAAKKWKRFQGKVLKAVEKQEAPHIRQFRQSNAITVAAGQQYFIPFTLNGLNGDVSIANDINDMADISVLMNRVSDPATGVATIGNQIKIISSYMDLELTNFTTTTNPAVPIMVDVYKCVARKDEKVSTVATDMNTLGKAYTNGYSQQVIGDVVGGTSVVPNIATLGCTPFDAPGFCQRWKIINKKRILLTPGSSISFTMGDPKTHILNSDVCNNFAVRRGLTKGYLVLLSSCINGNLAGAVTSPAFNVAFESLRTYRYKVIRDSIATGVSATS